MRAVRAGPGGSGGAHYRVAESYRKGLGLLDRDVDIYWIRHFSTIPYGAVPAVPDECVTW